MPREERQRTNDQISQELRRQLAGLPGVIVRANPAGGNFQLFRMLGGGDGDAGLALEIRGEDLDDARRIAQEAQKMMEAQQAASERRVPPVT